ncbi:hypothetical protein FO519_005808, partial [Halicephalobus sp. NKZ332]
GIYGQMTQRDLVEYSVEGNPIFSEELNFNADLIANDISTKLSFNPVSSNVYNAPFPYIRKIITKCGKTRDYAQNVILYISSVYPTDTDEACKSLKDMITSWQQDSLAQAAYVYYVSLAPQPNNTKPCSAFDKIFTIHYTDNDVTNIPQLNPTVKYICLNSSQRIGSPGSCSPFSGANSQESCPENSTLSFNGDVCWFFFDTPMDFVTSESYCRGFGGHLASVHNGFDNVYLADKARSLFGQGQFGLGGNRIQDGQNWTWISGEPFDFTDWASGEPQNGNESDCLHVDVSTASWYSADCFSTVPFVCQVPLGGLLSTTVSETTVFSTTFATESSETTVFSTTFITDSSDAPTPTVPSGTCINAFNMVLAVQQGNYDNTEKSLKNVAAFYNKAFMASGSQGQTTQRGLVEYSLEGSPEFSEELTFDVDLIANDISTKLTVNPVSENLYGNAFPYIRKVITRCGKTRDNVQNIIIYISTVYPDDSDAECASLNEKISSWKQDSLLQAPYVYYVSLASQPDKATPCSAFDKVFTIDYTGDDDNNMGQLDPTVDYICYNSPQRAGSSGSCSP